MLCLCAAANAAQAKTVRVGLYENMPKIFTDDKGRADGIFIDLLEEIARAEGWRLVFVPCEWEACLDALERGRIELMPDVAYSKERDELFDFHQIAVAESWSQAYSRPGMKISGLADLNGRRVAVLKGSIQQKALKQTMEGFGFKVTIAPASSFEEAFEMVARGSADAAITNRFFGDYAYQRHKLSKTPVVFNVVPLFYATGQGRNRQLLDAIDQHLGDWIRQPNSPYYKTMYRWEEKPPETVVPRALLWILGAIGGLLALAAGAILLLRQQVRARTVHLELANRELEKHRDHLEEIVADRTRELALARDNAEAADRLKSVFLASMSHELRTPLNSIIGFTGIILMGLAGDLNDEQKKQLNMVKNSASHLLSLINDILDISKIESGKVDLSPEQFSLKDVVNEVAETVTPAASEKNLKLIVETGEDIVLYSDRRRVKQILVNLAGNAVKFTEKGQVAIAAGTENGAAAVRVADTGPGIRQEDMHLLFSPFQQIGADVAKKQEGTGLGLHLCKKLAAMLGGGIEAQSTFGQGSVFTLRVPLNLQKETAHEENPGD